MTTLAERALFPHVLLVEDNHGDTVLVRLAFKKVKMPANITIAETAEIGLMVLQRKGKFRYASRPDIILLDLNLPYMHGLAFLEEVKNDPDLATIPVIVLTSSSAERDVGASYAGHANGYFIKPTSLDDYDRFAASIEAYWFELAHTPAATQARFLCPPALTDIDHGAMDMQLNRPGL